MDTLLNQAKIAMLPAAQWTIECISTEEGLAALEEDWNSLSAACGAVNIFMSYSWFRAWSVQTLRESAAGLFEIHVLVVRQGEEVIGIVPLVQRIAVRAGLRVRKLEFVTLHADYNELILGANTALLTRAVMDHLASVASDWDLIDLMDVRDRNGSTEQVREAAFEAGLRCKIFAEASCPHMPIDAPWAEIMKRKPLRFARYAYRVYTKKASEGLRIRVVDEPHMERDLLERIIAVEAQKRVKGQLVAPVIGRFPEIFQALIDDLGPRGLIASVLVEKEERLIAWMFLFRCGDELWDYLTAYDASYASLSPGTLLVCGALEYGFERGCAEFDFLRGMDEYKLRWTSSVRRNRRIIVWNRRVFSRASAWALLHQRRRYAAASCSGDRNQDQEHDV